LLNQFLVSDVSTLARKVNMSAITASASWFKEWPWI
jgi:hypothetical protein